MKISNLDILITVLIAKSLAAAASSPRSRSPLEVDGDAVKSLIDDEYKKYCAACSDLLLDDAEKKRLEEGNDALPSLASCPRSPQHVTHTKCLVHWFSTSISCMFCREECTEYIQQALFNPSVGSREFKKELLIGLTDIRIERQDAINFYKQLQMFPAEFVELRQKLCELGEASANAVNALDGAWHMQLGVPVLSRYFETNGIALPAPYEFYDTLREHMNNNSPTFAEAISFIGTVYTGYEIRAPEEIACRAFLISNILNDLKYSMSDNDVYELLVLFVKNGDHDCISMLIRCGRVIRDISAEKIIELLECLEKGEHAKFIPIWATWLMVGAGRKFAPEDMQAIRSCIDNIHAKYAELKHADEYMDELAQK